MSCNLQGCKELDAIYCDVCQIFGWASKQDKIPINTIITFHPFEKQVVEFMRQSHCQEYECTLHNHSCLLPCSVGWSNTNMIHLFTTTKEYYMMYATTTSRLSKTTTSSIRKTIDNRWGWMTHSRRIMHCTTTKRKWIMRLAL